MNWKHWIGIVLIFLVGYIVGKNFSIPMVPTFSGMGGKMGGGGGG